MPLNPTEQPTILVFTILNLFTTASLKRNKILPNERPGYHTIQSDGEVPVPEAHGNMKYLFIDIAPNFTLTLRVTPERVLSMGPIERLHFNLNF